MSRPRSHRRLQSSRLLLTSQLDSGPCEQSHYWTTQRGEGNQTGLDYDGDLSPSWSVRYVGCAHNCSGKTGSVSANPGGNFHHGKWSCQGGTSTYLELAGGEESISALVAFIKFTTNSHIPLPPCSTVSIS